ncbi:DNA polymerase III subunit epsilon [Tahibacter amnicola]|uniref:DNA polymerase III subunit epsilon n=1 Tax=Tahibacter amnicola TaxID=2976241 RepID=A0ABY6BJI0_9GAMM|nr:DNA polymerase III subunit epsilon [Tahibacter amnicola]UXI69622.1 DNA polymerase III subunit epsilon [Tahibacter amnicola]
MRQVILDTETTGLDAARGHRLIEVGCVELLSRRVSGSHFHRYIHPDRDIDAGAQAVHGISIEFLADKPRFAEIVDEFLAYIRGAELIIHNAAFDVGFLDAELARLGPQYGRITDYCTVLDTLLLAREQYPGQRNSLDALCKRLDIDNSHRQLHGALLDAEILADVYLAMTAGQGALDFVTEAAATDTTSAVTAFARHARPAVRVRLADATEQAAHDARVAAIDKASKGNAVWRRLDAPPVPEAVVA